MELNSKYESLREDYHQLSKIITGNGDPTHGLVVQMDRLQQDAKRRGIWLRAALGSALSALTGLIVMAIKEHLK